MFERILVALDGSADSRNAAELGIRLASRFDSRVTAQFVIDARVTEGSAVDTLAPLWGEISPLPFRAEVMQAWRDRSDTELSWFADRATQAEIKPIERYEDVGLAEESILARAASADLVVMGRRGENAGFGLHPVGSTLARVLRHSPHPILAAELARKTDGASAEERRLPADVPRVCLVAYDGREPAARALDLAIRYCSAAPAEIRLLVAGDEDCEALLEPAHRLCHDHDIAWESVRLDAEPADAVAEAVQRWNADCLFMGAFGHGRLHDLFVGSRTEEILGAVSVPAFLVR
ncbi:MAG: universal stress protein [Gemmatimonadetes bacterium]|nr:universal stress protein [Gemmatimonadota bacterium]